MSDPQRTYLDFERPIAELDNKIEELENLSNGESGVDVAAEITTLRAKSSKLLSETYANLDPWRKTQVARHPNRPHFRDFRTACISDFAELRGDRCFGDDRAIIGGTGVFRGRPVMILGHEKGHDTKSRLLHNFGMARPEGYRKAVRIMKMADRFNLPVLSFVDTAGAYPGIGAEERGQAEAIARSTECCLTLGVPLVTLIIGEGGSGGAVALAAASHLMMLEHSVYSVISPEGCASILWSDAAKAKEAATAMKVTATDLKALKIIDEIIPEPIGGAHRDPVQVIQKAGDAIERALDLFTGLSGDEIRARRKARFYAIGRSGI
ncbi:Acetyl-coenzyme A carboxyl transferase alpha chain [hydrothermal vent metagenome]|uniref:acetyl-CoA carboxytransferase n=1 Tax=hydrothermal vent metagenome TaxID=652676 RepID=A0A3B0RLL4_9ZZZZ